MVCAASHLGVFGAIESPRFRGDEVDCLVFYFAGHGEQVGHLGEQVLHCADSSVANLAHAPGTHTLVGLLTRNVRARHTVLGTDVDPLRTPHWEVGHVTSRSVRTTDQTLPDEVTNRLAQELHPEGNGRFGSHAWGTPDEGSDRTQRPLACWQAGRGSAVGSDATAR